MAVSLRKGQTISLKKEAPNLKRVIVGLGWDPVVKKNGFFGAPRHNFDIDSSVICIDEMGRHVDTISYKKLENSSGSIIHHGDNLTGDGDGDDEQIEIMLDKLPSKIQELAIIINIFDAYRRRQDFGDVKNCFVHVDEYINKDSSKELCRYNIDGNFNNMTGIFVAELYRHNGEWKFKAVGQGAKVSGIDEMVRMQCSR